MSVTEKGSIYDRIINEEWMSTPDMGEYMNNSIFKESIKGLSKKPGAEYYIEKPPVEYAGYNDQLKVVAIKCNPDGMIKYMDDYHTVNNIFDGDTIRLDLNCVENTTERFKVHYDDLNIYNGVRDYLKRTLKLSEDFDKNNESFDQFDIRLVGINSPESIHYGEPVTNKDNSDVYVTKYKNLLNNETNVTMKNEKHGFKVNINKSIIKYKPFSISGNTFTERDPEEDVKFVKLVKSEELYPSIEDYEKITYHEIVENLEETNSKKKRRVVFSIDNDIFTKGLEYSIQAKKAQTIVKETISSAKEVMIVLDTVGLNGAKKEIPWKYRKSYEKSTYNPFYSLYDMWKSIANTKMAYKYASYQAPGVEANGRFLGAVYVKVMNNGSPVWINLNKKVAFECDMVERNPDYSDSPDSIADYHYLSTAFRLWTYDYDKQLFVDDFNAEVLKTKDDRAEIQKAICGVDLDEMKDHTIMIGDCLFMIPPTAIKVVTQTRSSKAHLIRAKGSMQKTLPKTERIIQLDLFFNGEQGINGVPVKRKLPNGMEKIYMMNGLRSLIAQFKLAPFMPIHNRYINEILNIDAVALASYTVNTVPNYPRTLQVTLMMYEFEWRQYMPSQSVPDINGQLYRNLFSDTIHFPLLRYYYQQAIERGEQLKNGDLKTFAPNSPEYIKKTIGNRTALQPMDFQYPLFDLYIPDEDTLSERKQLKMAMVNRPLGQTFNFNEKQKEFMANMFEINHLITKIKNTIDDDIYSITNLSDKSYDVMMSGKAGIKKQYNLSEGKIIFNHVKLNKNKTSVDKVIKDDKWSKTLLTEIENKAKKMFFDEKIKFGKTLFEIESKISYLLDNKILYSRIDIEFIINESFFDEKSDLELIKTFCAKYGELNADEIFKNNRIQLSYVAEFATDDMQGSPLDEVNYMNKPFSLQDSESWAAVRYMASYSEINKDGTTSFSWDKVLNKIKDSMDLENEYSIKYNKYELHNPIVTSISSSYNNIFANVSLKAIDGHAAQYTGGSDAAVNIEMICNEETVSSLQLLSRKCVDFLIEYRRVLISSPLRIDSDLTRLLGLYEVIIESLEIDTVPEYPGKYKVNLRLSSVDRTLRNKESLSRIKDLDNANTQKDSVINTKTFFDLKTALGKAEIYPDLELPTVVELEQAGFYFLKNKYMPERVYPDPDFYFLYWYPTFAENLRTTIIEYFSDPQNLKYNISDNLFKESFDMQVKVKNGDGKSFYEVMDWEPNKSYNEMIEAIKNLNVIVDKNGKPDKEENENLANLVTAKMAEVDKKNKEIAKLQEVIDMSIDQAFLVNKLTNICVSDYDVMDIASEAEKKEIQAIGEKVRKQIKEFLKNPMAIKPEFGSIYANNPNTHPQKKFGYPSEFIGFDSDMSKVMDKHEDFIKDLFKTILNTDKNIRNLDYKYIDVLIKAGAVGGMAKLPVFFGANKDLIDPKLSADRGYPSPYLPEVKTKVQVSSGKIEEVPICLYPAKEASELLIAHNDETREDGVLFGPAGIKKYDGSQLGALFKRPAMNDGFLDPFYNKDLYEEMFKQNGEDIDFEGRINFYIKAIMEDPYSAQEAFFRQMLVWLYILTLNDTFITSTQFYASKVYSMVISENPRSNASLVSKFMTTDTLDIEDEDEEESVAEIPYLDKKIKKYKNEINTVFGDDAYDNLKEATEEQDEIISQYMTVIAESGGKYVATLLHGIFFSLSMITMAGPSSLFLSSTCEGNLSGVSDIVQSAVGTNSLDDLSEEQKQYARFVQYCNFYLDEEERYERTDFQRTSYNNKIQRAYLKAANDPKVYMLHSFYDMVMHDKRGQMGRAFPTYYMLLIDEGREIGFWKLQDNFYDMNSIVEFEVVKSRKIAADTARIVMSNMHGVFNSEDEDMKDEMEYTMRDVFDSVFSPRKYFNKEYNRRKDARDINSAKMQPGARVHLRMGYSANAAELPIVFNGAVAEFENGEMMTLICQGDGVELSNPDMFNALDCDDVEDIQYSDAFMGYKQFLQKWNNLSTPRSLLVNPLAAEGSWVQEFIRKYSQGRFFNSNPFGIVHFGDRKFTDIFAANGEVEQNIYEGMSSPSWDYEKSGMKENKNDGLIREYSMMEAPKVRVGLNQGFSYWDVMHIAASISPDFISAIAPFQLRSTVFHGHPRFYYAYDYIKMDGKIIEKRKPFQQYHVYTSYSDIIANNISTSSRDVRTNAVGHYIGPSWLSTEPKTVGPLFVDIDIFPEYQKSTSVNLNFEYKSQELVPFTIPIKDKLSELDWTGKKITGEKVAWRATANALKDTIKDMYQGELIVMGDPTVKPFDRVTISDIYEDIAGNVEVESVVHMFSVDTGFTTSITPDCISSIDNTYDTMGSAVTANILLPVLASDALLVSANLKFHQYNRSLYLSMSRAAKHGGRAAQGILDSAKTLIGKEAMERDAIAISSAMPDILKDFLAIEDIDIQFYDKVKDLMKGGSVFNRNSVESAKGFANLVSDFAKLDDVFESVSVDNYNQLVELLSDPKFNKTGVVDALKKENIGSSIAKAMTDSMFDSKDLSVIKNTLDVEGIKDMPEAKAILELIKGKDSINPASKEGKEFLEAVSKLGNVTDSWSKEGPFTAIGEMFSKKAEVVKDSLKNVDKLDDVVDAAKTVKNSFKGYVKLFSGLTMAVVEACITKSAQEFLTKKLRNLQVLTIYPLKKNELAWTAGLNGHQGSVFGSLAYDEPGWLESMAIKFFDYGGYMGSEADGLFNGKKWLAILRDLFITTDEMRDIVNKYKRGNGYADNSHTQTQQELEAANELGNKLAKQTIQTYSDYKAIYLTERLTLKSIQNNDTEASTAYATYKITSPNIESDKSIDRKLKYIFDSSELIERLYKNKGLYLAYEYNADVVDSNVGFKEISIPYASDESKSYTVSTKVIPAKTDKELDVYDIPFLRSDALIIFKHFVQITLDKIQPDYKLPTCKFENIQKTPIILHSATKVNSTDGWRSTGFLFTVEVKNYKEDSNIIDEVLKEEEQIVSELQVKEPFTITKEYVSEYGANAYSFFAHCPKI